MINKANGANGGARGVARGGKTPQPAPSYSAALKKQSPSPHSQSTTKSQPTSGTPRTRMTVGRKVATPINPLERKLGGRSGR